MQTAEQKQLDGGSLVSGAVFRTHATPGKGTEAGKTNSESRNCAADAGGGRVRTWTMETSPRRLCSKTPTTDLLPKALVWRRRATQPGGRQAVSPLRPGKARGGKAPATSEGSAGSWGEPVFETLQEEARWPEGLCRPVPWPLAACGCLNRNQSVKVDTPRPGRAGPVPALTPTSRGSVGGRSRRSGGRGAARHLHHLPDDWQPRAPGPARGDAPGQQPPGRVPSPAPEEERRGL